MSVQTSVQLQNQMAPVLNSINTALNHTISTLQQTERASEGMFNTSSLNQARREIANASVGLRAMSSELDKIEKETIENARAQTRHNQEIKAGSNLFERMGSKVLGIVSAYVGMQSVKWLGGTSDQLTSINARLALAKKEYEDIEQLQSGIFTAAQNARGDYMLLADSVSKMSLMGGDAFKDTQEVIAFNEQLSKHFVVSGASAEGQAAAMYQLNQAMAMGVLRGQEYNSINENANTVIEAMAKHLNVTKGEIKAMADEGKISAELVKQSVLAMAEETDAKFSQMPMTFSQIGIQMKNTFYRNMQPALERLNELANSESFRQFVENSTRALGLLAQVLTQVISVGISGFNLMAQNGHIVIPIISGITTAMFGWWAVTMLQKLTLENLKKVLTMKTIGLALISAAVAIIVHQTMKWVESVGGIQVAWAIFFDKFRTGIENAHINYIRFEVAVNKGFTKMQDAGTRMAMKINDAVTQMAINGIRSIQNLINSAINEFNGLLRLINRIPGMEVDLIDRVTIGEDLIRKLEEANRTNDVIREQRLRDNEAKRASDQAFLTNLSNQYANNQRSRAMEIRSLQENSALERATVNLADNAQLGSIDTSLDGLKQDTDEIKKGLSWDNNNLSGLRDLMQSRAITGLSKEIKLEIYNEYTGNISSDLDVNALKQEVSDEMVRKIEIAINGGV